MKIIAGIIITVYILLIVCNGSTTVLYTQLSQQHANQYQLVYDLSTIWSGVTYKLDHSSIYCPSNIFAVSSTNGSIYLLQSLSFNSTSSLICSTNISTHYVILKRYSCFAIAQGTMISYGVTIDIHIIPHGSSLNQLESINATVQAGRLNSLVHLKHNPLLTAGPIEDLSVAIISGNVGDSFKLVHNYLNCYNSLQLITKKPLTPGTVFNLTLQSSLQYTFQVYIQVITNNTNPPIFLNTTTTNLYIKENTPIGTNVLTITAIDNDTNGNGVVRYITNHTYFTIDSISGNLYLSKDLSHSTMNHTSLCVIAHDLGYPSYSTEITIMIFIVTIPSSPPQLSLVWWQEVYNEILPLKSLIATFSATHYQINSSNISVLVKSDTCWTCFELSSGHVHNQSTIEYNITTSSLLDYESYPNGYPITIVATDNSTGLSSQLSIVVKITDNNEAPYFIKNNNNNNNSSSCFYTVSVSEGDPVGTQVTFVRARDDDAGVKGQLVYNIVSGNSHNWFKLDQKTGLISLMNQVNPSQEVMIVLNISVNDVSTNPLYTYTNICIMIQDIDNHTPSFSSTSYAVTIHESWPLNTPIYSFKANDLDATGCSGTVHYSISIAEPPLFTIDHLSGLLYANTSLDYEEFTNGKVTVIAKSLGLNNTQYLSQTILNVTITDVNDNVPVIEPIGCPCFMLEEQDYTQNCFPLSISDKDTNNTFKFMIVSGNHDNRFNIDTDTGTVSTATRLNHEAQNEYTLSIIVSDGINLSEKINLKIIIIDINDSPLTYASNLINLTIPQDTPLHSLVANLSANQSDVGYNGLTQYEYSTNTYSNVTNTFILDPLSGLLYLNSSQLVSGSKYYFTLSARDLVNSSTSTTVNVIINIGPNKNTPPHFELNYNELWISRNLLVNTSMITVHAMDESTVRYAIINDVNGLFNIHPVSGVVTIATGLMGVASSSVTLNISATDDMTPPLSLYTQLKIILYFPALIVNGVELNHNPGVGVCHHIGYYKERSNGGLIVVLPRRQSGHDITYTLLNGRHSNLFTINETSLTTQNNISAIDRYDQEALFVRVRAVYGSLFHFCSITVAINDSNNHGPVFSKEQYNIEIYHNTPIGAIVHQLTTSDRDLGLTPSPLYSLTTPSSLFSIETSTGLVRTISTLSTGANYTLNIIAKDGGNYLLNDTTKLIITVLSTNNSPPFISSSQLSLSLFENQSLYSIIIPSIGVIDNDVGSHGNLNYCIQDGNYNKQFVIQQNGSLSLVGSLNYEGQPHTRNMTVLVYDTSFNVRYNRKMILIYIKNVNDEVPQFRTSHYYGYIAEDSPSGSYILTVTATDKDPDDVINYSINDTRLIINQMTGALSLASTLDRETSHLPLTVRATDQSGHFSTANIDITVLYTVNNRRPVFDTSTNNSILYVPESRSINDVLYTVYAMDTDSGINGRISYWIYSGGNNLFSLNSKTGVIKLSRSLDYETDNHTHSLLIDAIDYGSPQLKTGNKRLEVTFKLTNLNDNYPKFSQDIYTCTVLEGTGNQVKAINSNNSCQIYANDADLVNNTITYTIINNKSPFNLNQTSGQVTLNSNINIDFETSQTYSLFVSATDNGTPPLSTFSLLIIKVMNINEHRPIFDPSPNTIILPFDISINTTIFFASAYDNDRQNITYALSSPSSVFSIDTLTGGVVIKTNLTTPTNYTLRVLALDSNFVKDKNYKIIFDKLNLNSIPPQFLPSNPSLITISKRTKVGVVIVTMATFDPDFGLDGTPRYYITNINGNYYFSINNTNGSISLKRSLKSFDLPYIKMTVMAKDSGFRPLYNLFELTIIISQEHKVIFDRPVYSITVNQSERFTGRIVGHVRLINNLQNQATLVNKNIHYSIVLGEGPSNVLPFSLNSSNGAICVNGDLSQTSYQFRVEGSDNVTMETTTALVNVNVIDNVNDFRPDFPSDFNTIYFPNSLSTNTSIFQIFITDRDTGIYSQSTFTLSPLNSHFVINSTSGRLYLASTPPPNSITNLIITANNHGLIKHHNISLIPFNITDNGSSILLAQNNVTIDLPFNTPVGSVIYTINTTLINNTWPLFYTMGITNTTNTSHFIIHPNTGAVYLSTALNSKLNFTSLSIEIYNKYGNTATFILNIQIPDTNIKEILHFTNSLYTFTIAEGTPLGTHIGQLDTNYKGLPIEDLTFSIADSLYPESLLLFNITNTGIIIINNIIDREELQYHLLTISVKNNEVEDLTTVYINITDINDNTPQFVTSHWSPKVVVPEDELLGNVVTIATAIDPDLNENSSVSYSLIHNNNIPFSINNLTGEIVLIGELDYEKVTSYTLELLVFNPFERSSNSTHSLTISVLDVIDTYPNLTTVSDSVFINENESPYTYVHAIKLASLPHPVVYTIERGNELRHFLVEPYTGVIRTLYYPLDRESVPFYNLTIRVSFNAIYYTNFNIIVNLRDVNDHSPKSSLSNLTFFVSENTPVFNQIIFNISLYDLDSGNNGEIQAPIILDSLANSVFSINNVGECTLKKSLDREERDRYQFDVLISDNSTFNPLYSRLTLTIHVTDVNDNDPEFNSHIYELVIETPTLPNEILWSALATDRDITSNRLTYFINGGSGAGIFYMDSLTGDLRIRETFNNEISFYDLLIMARDEGGRNATTRLHINMKPCRFNFLSFTPPSFSLTLSEDTPLNTIILSPSLYEFNITGTYVFSLTTNSNYFNINSSTGQLILIKPLDREIQNYYKLAIFVQDVSSTTSLRVAKATVTITITDVNDNFPIFIGSPYAAFVTDLTPAGTIIHSITANDTDLGSNSDILYSIISDPSLSFVINSSTGIVALSQSLDPSIVQSYFQLIIQASDQGVPVRKSNTSLSITLINSNAPNFSQAIYTATLREDTKKDTQVVNVTASGQASNSLIFYSFINITDLRFPFSLNPQTGLITVNDRGLDYELKTFYSFFVQAEDVRNSLFSRTQIYITITDVNDQRPTFSNALYIVDVKETVAVGTTILQVQASDGDTPPNAKLRYSLVTQSDVFRIDPLTGHVISTSSLDYETITRYQLTVRASDSGVPQLNGTATIRIIITNINDNPPVFTSLPILSVSEGASTGTILTFVTATDPDNDNILYNLTQNSSNNFQLSPNGLLRLNTQSISLTEIKYVLNISASDGIHVIYGTLIVNIDDINNHSPMFNQSVYHATIVENSPSNISLVTLYATDNDRDNNALITYSIFDSTFKIDSSSGHMTTSSINIDRETTPTFNIIAIARDGGGLTDTAVVMVTVSDVNDNRPTFRQSSYAAFIPEGEYNNDYVLTVQADDPDLGSSGSITYNIISNLTYFYINSDTGVVTTSGPLDYETMPTHSFQVTATDGGGLVSDVVTVTVNLTNIGDTNPTFSQSVYHVNVSENAQIGQIILRPNVSFHDDCTPSDYEIYNRPSNFPFRFDDGSSGVLRVTGTLNRIQTSSYNFIIRVTCLYVTYVNLVPMFEARRNLSDVIVTITDVNEAPSIQSQFGSIIVSPQISEAANISTPVLSIRATDNDLGFNAVIRYRFNINQSSIPFAISSENGTIYVSHLLDRETAPPYYTIPVQAYDLGTPSLSSTATVLIPLQDVNDSPPKFTCYEKNDEGLCVYNVSVPENILPNSTIATLTIQDPDITGDISFILSSHFFNVTSVKIMSDSANNRGQSYNGVISTAQGLDRESVDYYELTILVSDGVYTQSALVLINITDINDNSPQFSQTQFIVSVNENHPVNTSFIIINATDDDLDENSIITYTLLDSPVARNISLNPSTGHVSFLIPPDRETTNRLEFHLKASDVGSLEDFATLLVNIIDVNDNYPIFTNNNYTASVYENRTSNVELLYISATDRDQGSNGLVRYSIDEESSVYFIIDSVTGLLRAKHRLIDREVRPSFNITVTASDSGEDKILSTNTTLQVTVLDINDNAPSFEQSSYSVSVPEGMMIGTIINNFTVSDKDVGSNAQLIYDLSGNGKDSFVLESTQDGVTLKVNGELNSESVSIYHLFLSATDEGIPALKTTIPLTIHVLDRNEHKPEFTRNEDEFTFREDTPIGSALPLIKAFDLDPADVNLTYSLRDNFTEFSVDSHTGNITIVNALDFETTRQYTLHLIASEPRPNPQTAQTTIRITITDVNDNRPEFLCSSSNISTCPHQNFSVYENSHDVVLANLTVRDNDTVTNPNLITFAITSGERRVENNDILFKIDPLFGVLKLLRPLDREERDTYQLTITASDGDSQNPLTGTVQITVHVLDLNDNQPLGGTQHIFINLYGENLANNNNNKIPVYTNDLDIINNHTFISINSSELINIERRTGLLTLLSNTELPSFTVQILITDRLYNGSIVQAITTVYIDVHNVSSQTKNNLFTIIFSGISSEDFIRHRLVSFNTTLNELISKKINDTIKLLFISIRDTPIIANSTQITLGAYRPLTHSYIHKNLLQNIIYINKELIQEKISNVFIASVDYDLCSNEPCSNRGLCSLSENYSSQSFINRTPRISYLGLRMETSVNCSCFTGFTGQTCSTSCPECVTRINTCLTANCTSNCQEVKGQPVCIDDCASSPCKYGGVCIRQTPSGYYCACPSGYNGPNCELTIATFNGVTSHALFPSISLVHKGVVSFEFITDQRYGTLLYAGHYDVSFSDYIMLYLHNNTVVCSVSLGSKEYMLTADGVNAADKEWINVLFEYSTTELLLKVTKYSTSGYSHKTSQVYITASSDNSFFLDLTTPLLIGKILPQYYNLSFNDSSPAPPPYKGCIRNIHINEKVLDFTGPLSQEGLSTGCHFTDVNCDSDPCSNSGQCIGDWESFKCSCTDQYTGVYCDNETITGSFTGKEYITYDILIKDGQTDNRRGRIKKRQTSSTVYSTSFNSIYISFSTQQNEAAVLLQMGRQNSDHIIIEIQSGYIQVRVDIGGGEKILQITTIKINDDTFHNLTLTRRGPQVTLIIDNKYITRDTLNITNDPQNSIFLNIDSLIAGGGNPSQTSSQTNSQANSNSRNFHGCIQKMTIDGHDLPITGQTRAFIAHNNQPITTCDYRSSPPSFLSVISTLYVMFGVGLTCLIFTALIFVFICKTSHYSYTKKRHGFHPMNERRNQTRFIDFNTPTQSTPASTMERPFIRAQRQERGLQSTTSFEPLDISSRQHYEAYRKVHESPSLASESVFEVENEYELDPIPRPELSRQPIVQLSCEPMAKLPRQPIVESSWQPQSSWQPGINSSQQPIVQSSKEQSHLKVLPLPPAPPSLPPPSPPPSHHSSLPPSHPPSPSPIHNTIVQQETDLHPKMLEVLEMMGATNDIISSMEDHPYHLQTTSFSSLNNSGQTSSPRNNSNNTSGQASSFSPPHKNSNAGQTTSFPSPHNNSNAGQTTSFSPPRFDNTGLVQATLSNTSLEQMTSSFSPPRYNNKNLGGELLDPMTGMTLHDGCSHSNESLLIEEYHDGREEVKRNLRKTEEERESERRAHQTQDKKREEREEREEREREEEMEEDDIQEFITEKLQHANTLLLDINYDTVYEYTEEGNFDPLGSIGSLYDILQQQNEQKSTKVTQPALKITSPTKNDSGGLRIIRSPKDSSPQRPSPLLKSAKQAPPPIVKPKPVRKPSKTKLFSENNSSDIHQKDSPIISTTEKSKIETSPTHHKKESLIKSSVGGKSNIEISPPKKKSSPPRFQQLNKQTGEELSPSNRSKLKRNLEFSGSVTQL